MSAPFAAIEARVNAVTHAKLANVTATINYMPVDGIFDEHYAVAFNVSEGTRPVLQCIASAVYGDMKGAPAEVNGVEYTVVEVQPDGTGMVLLVLEKD